MAPKKKRDVRPAESPPVVEPGLVNPWAPSRRTAAVVLGIVCVAALLSRVVIAWDHVFPETGDVRLLGVDPYYHLRHAQFAAAHFPDLQRWDIGTHYPTGQRAYTASLFDVGIATIAFVVGLGDPSERLVTQVAALIPSILGALSIAFLYLLARAAFNRMTGLVASVVYLLYPGTSLHRTLLGFADHHVAEIALGLLTAWGLTRYLQKLDLGEPGWRPLLSTLGYALPPALLMFTWAGGAIYLLILLVILMAMSAVEIAHNPEAMVTARGSLLYGGALFLMIAFTGFVWPDLVMSVYRFPQILMGCVALTLIPAMYSYAGRALVRRFGSARIVAIVSSVVLAVIAVVFVWQHPLANNMISQLLGEKIATLAEHRAVDWALYWKLLGPGGVLAPLGILLALIRSVRSAQGRYSLVAIFMGMAWIGLWLMTRDYDYAPPALIGLLVGCFVNEMLVRFPALGMGLTRIASVAVMIAVVVCPIWPLQNVMMPWATTAVVKEHLVINDGWEQAMEWLRNETPKPSIAVDDPVEPWTDSAGGFRYPADSYGVFVPWDFGNMVAALGKRTPVWSQWTSKDGAEWILCEDEEKSRQLLCPRCEEGEQIRYVVIEARTIANHFPGKVLNTGRPLTEYDTQSRDWYTVSEEEKILHRTFGPHYHRSMAVRAYLDDARDMGHYRLVYESPHESYMPYLLEYGTYKYKRIAFPINSETERNEYAARSGIGRVGKTHDHFEYDGVITATVKIFEHVEGARVQGTAAANSVVEAHLFLRCGPEDRLLKYARSTQTGADGRFELVVPHATTPGTGAWTCSAEGAYEIITRATPKSKAVKAGRLLVEDSQVRHGEVLEVGRLK